MHLLVKLAPIYPHKKLREFLLITGMYTIKILYLIGSHLSSIPGSQWQRCTGPGLAHLNGTLPSVMIGAAKFSAARKIYWPSGPYFLSATLKPFLNYVWPSVLFFTPPYEIFPLCWGCFRMLPPDSPLVVSEFRKHHSQTAVFFPSPLNKAGE